MKPNVLVIYWMLASWICITESRYKFGRPMLSTSARLPPQMSKKSFPMTHRLSMVNTFHNGAHVGHKRLPSAKPPPNYRIRRPPMYNVMNVMPTTALYQGPGIYGVMDGYASLPQRLPMKEFHTMNKAPEYTIDYRPGSAIVPPTRRLEISDDKSAIHTIPAPNLSLADKPHTILDMNANLPSHQDLRQYYDTNVPGNFGFVSSMTSTEPKITVTSSPPTHHYEVTEPDSPLAPKDDNTVHSLYYTPHYDVTRLPTTLNPDYRTNLMYMNDGTSVTNDPELSHLTSTNVDFGQSNNAPMQTNMHSSLHVGFPGTAGQAPSPMGHRPEVDYSTVVNGPSPSLPATQIEDLLNSFPRHTNDQRYNLQNQQSKIPDLSHHQFSTSGQLFQPTGEGASFTRPKMHSFNDGKQRNDQQQQQQQQQQSILDGRQQDYYTQGRVIADYNLNTEPTGQGQTFNIHINDISENTVNNEQLEYTNSKVNDEVDDRDDREDVNGDSDYEKINGPYFESVDDDGERRSGQFYMALPDKVAAEKLAALAAAGDVNSHLIHEIRKQQQQQQQQQQQNKRRGSQKKREDEDDVRKTSDVDVGVNNHKDIGEYENDRDDDDTKRQRDSQRDNDQHGERYDDEEQIYDEKQ